MRLADSGGLDLDVSPNGSRRWFWKYRFAGKEKRLTLGHYTEVGSKRVSVSLKDDFLRAVETDADWHLTARKDGKVMKTLKARDLWEKIGHAAWASADPGLHLDTTMKYWRTSPAACSSCA